MKMAILTKINAMPIEIPMPFFAEREKLVLNFM
jgi:hypothetical protein